MNFAGLYFLLLAAATTGAKSATNETLTQDSIESQVLELFLGRRVGGQLRETLDRWGRSGRQPPVTNATIPSSTITTTAPIKPLRQRTTPSKPPRAGSTKAPPPVRAHSKPPNCDEAAALAALDPRTFARTAEEALLNFPDLSRSQAIRPDELGPPADIPPPSHKGGKGTPQASPLERSEQRRNPRCQAKLIQRFQRLGLVNRRGAWALRRKLRVGRAGDPCPSAAHWRPRRRDLVEVAKTRGATAYRRLSAQAQPLRDAPVAGKGRKPPKAPTADVLNSCSILDADSGAAWATVLVQMQAEQLAEKRRNKVSTSDTRLAKVGDWESDPRFPGRMAYVTCTRRGDPEADGGGGWVAQCNQCWGIRTLPDGYIVRYINELVCGSKGGTTQDDIKCLGGFGKCHQRTEERRVPYRDPSNGRISYRHIPVRTCCDCKVLNGSPLHRFISK